MPHVSRVAVPFAAGIMTLFAVMAVFFASHQAIWIDETTQLFGLTLPPVQQVQWLSGAIEIASGVPPDRAAPLSYWLGGLWAGLFGLDEMSMRIFGILCVLTGAPAIWMAGCRLGGTWGGIFALAVIYLSPNMVVQAGEIRSYPLYFAFCAWASWALVEVLLRPAWSRRHLTLLAVFLILANYTHFFGLVLSGFVAVTLGVVALVERRPLAPILVAVIAALVLSTGILPFLMGAVNVTGDTGVTEVSGSGIRDALIGTAKLVFRLALHGSAFVFTPLVGMALLALAALALRALVVQRPGPRQSEGLYLLLPVLLGLVMLPLISLKISGFNVLAVHYNLWIIPLVSLFLTGAFRNGALYWSAIPALVLIGTHLGSNAILLRHAALYSHGPGEWLYGQISDPQHALVIHDPDGPWAQAYFPVYALSRGRVMQVLQEDGTWRKIVPGGLEKLPDAFSVDDFQEILLVKTKTLSSQDLTDEIGKPGTTCGIEPIEARPGPLSGPLSGPVAQVAYCAYASALVGKVSR